MSDNKNKYTSLISNTLIFALGAFGSKVLPYLLRPLYTSILPPEQMSTASLITATCNMILPVMYLCIAESVIRFGMDSQYPRGDVFSVGFWTVLGGYAVFLCFYPLMTRWPNLEGYTWLIYLYVFTSAMHTLVSQFVRALGMVKLFTIDGIFTTVLTVAANLVFLLVFHMGIEGYVLGTVVADGLSALLLFACLRLRRFLRFRGIDKVTLYDMFRYALPLIPTAVGWWVIHLSDRQLVASICGQNANGVYGEAYLIPNLIIQISAVFTRAWELSAFTEYKGAEGEKFFSTVFRSYYTLVFVMASGLMLIVRPMLQLLLDSKYHEAWRYAPFLLVGTGFSCLVTFLGAIYNAAKQNGMITVTTLIGAVTNVVLNLLLIPKYGPQGAGFATFISYLLVFVIRAVDTRRFIRIQMKPGRIVMTLALLLLQCWILIAELPWWPLWEALAFLVLVICNFGYILFMLRRLLYMLRRRRA